MIIRDIRDVVKPGASFQFVWGDVDDRIPEQVNFWLTHYTDDGSGHIDPVKLNDRPVKPRNQDSLTVDADTTRKFVCAPNYRIWCMKVESDPENDKSPFCESPGFRVMCSRD
ncbi:uncharacterized protein DSM5745_00097 [Aspergillus mulundensis]|uniref:Uncharacterized protein n=1 Tax=Aspergillus mulundensis TaxID=1810919 RepID=A0A3D8T2I4_9EURO|nr:hypothetical protein DSM5745_00097 [Aspergillus mulundensis]RDW92775.1 hypothetical protein DSM5745_00097 [Aspergillus mulundensis]